jgi:predicted ATPase/DNA-binding transcriptional LysR family regulator
MQVEARLRAFAAVARNGSFSRAADELYVSQPAVSKHVASLEAELGTELVLRRRSGATLTPAGELLADYVLRAEALLANARRAVGSGAESGVLSVAASGIPGTYLIPKHLAGFHAQLPDVQIDFRVLTSGEALDLVRAHAVELAVVGGLDVPHELESEPLVEDELVLVGPASLGGRRLRPKDIAGSTWISREEGSSTRAAVEAARWQLGLHAVRTLELPTWEAVKQAVAHGAGIAAISRSALELELQAQTLAVLDVPRWRVWRTISIVRARGVPLTPPAERFLAQLREAFAAPDEDVLPPNSNLPAATTPLIGRERELEEVAKLLQRRSVRLVTLTGAGGSGKTRLALEAAAGLVDRFRDGVYLVELGPIADAGHVEATIAHVLGVEDLGDLGDRELLLLLDNFEHLLEATPAVATLLSTSSRLKILATSRAPLRVRGEHDYGVQPLPPRDAVALFVERALAADPAFEDDPAVAMICERLDGLPLAIELAAARVRTFPPQMLNERLESRLPLLVGGARDLPSRQRTLRATIQWSYDLLDDDRRQAFASLAVFRGGFDAEGARSVCDVDDVDIVTLVENSLLRRDDDQRFSMLETIGELAAELLAGRPDADALRRRHLEHALLLARTAQQHARGPEQQTWFDRLEHEHANVRAAIAWATKAEPELALALADALEPFWTRRHHREALGILEPLLETGDGPADLRAGVLTIAGTLASEAERLDDAERWLMEALELTPAPADRERRAWALKGLGRLASTRGDFAAARAQYEESLALFEELGLRVPAGGRLNDLAMLARAAGDIDQARAFSERALAISRTTGDPHGVPGDLHTLADIELDAEEFERARSLFGEALGLTIQTGERYQIAHCLGGLAAAAAAGGEPGEAHAIWAAVLDWEAESGKTIEPPSRDRYVELIGETTDRVQRCSWDEAVARARALGR